jgi:hypothetical protein
VTTDPERAPFVQLAFELCATGEYNLERLAALGSMLRNRYYLGVVTYEGVEYPGRHPALVSQELFDQVQSILDASGVSGERRRRHDHYLMGTLWCDRCDQRGERHRLILMKATGRRGTDYFYVLCRGRQEGICDLPYLAVEHVEEAVLRYWASQRLPDGFSQRVRDNLQGALDEATPACGFSENSSRPSWQISIARRRTCSISPPMPAWPPTRSGPGRPASSRSARDSKAAHPQRRPLGDRCCRTEGASLISCSTRRPCIGD